MRTLRYGSMAAEATALRRESPARRTLSCYRERLPMIRKSFYIKLKFFTFCGIMNRCNVIIDIQSVYCVSLANSHGG